MDGIQSVIYENESASTPDFSLFVTKPIIPSDVKLSNGSESWAFHKAVLRKLSPVFADILNGDNTLTEIQVDGVSSESLTIFQKFVYTKREQQNDLFRDSELESGYEISDAEIEELNGVYIPGGIRGGVIKYVRQANGKSYEISRASSTMKKLRWWVSRTDVSPDLDFCVCACVAILPPNYGWKLKTSENIWTSSVLKVVRTYLPKADFPLTYQTITGLHTIIAKYNLKLPTLNAYLKWLYSSHWSPNIKEFSSLVEDAREKGLNDLANIALSTQIETFDFGTTAEYPVWFQKVALRKHENHADYATIVGVVSKRAMQEDNVEVMSVVQKSLSSRSLEFKGRVLDVQLQAHKKRKLE